MKVRLIIPPREEGGVVQIPQASSAELQEARERYLARTSEAILVTDEAIEIEPPSHKE